MALVFKVLLLLLLEVETLVLNNDTVPLNDSTVLKLASISVVVNDSSLLALIVDNDLSPEEEPAFAISPTYIPKAEWL